MGGGFSSSSRQLEIEEAKCYTPEYLLEIDKTAFKLKKKPSSVVMRKSSSCSYDTSHEESSELVSIYAHALEQDGDYERNIRACLGDARSSSDVDEQMKMLKKVIGLIAIRKPSQHVIDILSDTLSEHYLNNVSKKQHTELLVIRTSLEGLRLLVDRKLMSREAAKELYLHLIAPSSPSQGGEKKDEEEKGEMKEIRIKREEMISLLEHQYAMQQLKLKEL